jgi:hypothetical protein
MEYAASQIGTTDIKFSIAGDPIQKQLGNVPAGKEVKLETDVSRHKAEEAKVTIDGIPAHVQDGIARFSKTAEGQGKKMIPVLIEFKMADGSKVKESYEIVYTVIPAGKSTQ